MIRLLIGLLGAASLVVTVARPAFAGVVMNETSTHSGPSGETMQNRIVYVQGNKQKVESNIIDTITDLDKNAIYIIDKSKRTYAELPLLALTPAQPSITQSGITALKDTGKRRVIAKNSCKEYRATAGNAASQTSISACVSESAPGASEVTAFERKMISRLTGAKMPKSSNNKTSALVLEKQSSLNLLLPDLSGNPGYRAATLLAKTQISEIRVTPLAAATFEPPKDFNKVQERRPDNRPLDAASASEET